jgi:hypothetical protein
VKTPRIPRIIAEQLSKDWTSTCADEREKREIFGQNAWWRQHQWPRPAKPTF